MKHVHTRIPGAEIDAILQQASPSAGEDWQAEPLYRITAVDVRGPHHVTSPSQLSPGERAAISDAAEVPLVGGAGETEMVNTDEAAGMLNCSRTTVLRYIHRDVLPVRQGSGQGRTPYLIARHLVAALRRHVATGGNPYAFTLPKHA